MKRRQSQAELIKNLSDRDLIVNLYLTQLLLVIVSLVSGFFWFDHWHAFFRLFQWLPEQIVLYGGGLAIVVIVVDFSLTKWVPKRLYDDGGINERMFSALPVWHIFFVTFLISLGEEILFRGVVQPNFGIIAASVLFSLLHIRYLRKFLLFAITVVLSFLLGILFFYTQNLLVTVFAHFVIDFVSGVAIRLKHEKEQREKKGAEFMGDQNQNHLDWEETEKQEVSSLPSRKEYHRRKNGKKKRKAKRRNPFILARILLAVFIILVIAVLAYSISNRYFL